MTAAIGEPPATLGWPARPAGLGEPEAAVRPGDSCSTETRGSQTTAAATGSSGVRDHLCDNCSPLIQTEVVYKGRVRRDKDVTNLLLLLLLE